MSALHTVNVDLKGHAYSIHMGQNLLRQIPQFIPFDLKDRRLFILTDETVSNPHAIAVFATLKACAPETLQMLALPAGEQSKSFVQLERVMGWLLDHGVDRRSVLFAVGGGVVGDIGGLAAALALRGISCVQIPTTLLAQVDSAVGGKTAINMPQGKNLVGVFYQPAAVICDLDTLETLPRRQLLAGYAEVLKYALIGDPEFFIWLERQAPAILAREPQALAKAIETSCRKKAEIVERDEKEQGNLRALLNFGHTFGHALEAATHYDGRLLHGEGVAIGMVMAMQLSCRLGHCPQEDVDRVEHHLSAAGLPTRAAMIFPPLECGAAGILKHMKRDKKALGENLVFILARGIGKACVLRDVPFDDVQEVITHSMKEI